MVRRVKSKIKFQKINIFLTSDSVEFIETWAQMIPRIKKIIQPWEDGSGNRGQLENNTPYSLNIGATWGFGTHIVMNGKGRYLYAFIQLYEKIFILGKVAGVMGIISIHSLNKFLDFRDSRGNIYTCFGIIHVLVLYLTGLVDSIGFSYDECNS